MASCVEQQERVTLSAVLPVARLCAYVNDAKKRKDVPKSWGASFCIEIEKSAIGGFQSVFATERLLLVHLVRYGENLAAFGTTACKHATTVGCGHSQAKAMLVDSLSV